eukprot:2242467-Alexandrium_andersonii.AAC.1
MRARASLRARLKGRQGVQQAHRLLASVRTTPLLVMADAEGCFTAEPLRVDALVREAWGAVYGAGECVDVTVGAAARWLEDHEVLLHGNPFPVPAISARDVFHT